MSFVNRGIIDKLFADNKWWRQKESRHCQYFQKLENYAKFFFNIVCSIMQVFTSMYKENTKSRNQKETPQDAKM